MRTRHKSEIQGLPQGRRERSVVWPAKGCSRVTVISSCPALDFSSVRNVFRRPVVMPFRPAVCTSPPANSRGVGQTGLTRVSVGFVVVTRLAKAEPVHFVPTNTASDALRPSSHE